jgi:Ser/Thr protein kinase RdoA (MazF antagonist)
MTTSQSNIENMQAELGSALPRWGMFDAKLTFLSHSENTTFLARDPRSGQRLVLRVQRIGYHASAEILSELSWISALIADAVIETPRPIPDRDGVLLCPVPLNGSMRQVVAFEYMSGEQPSESASLQGWFRKLGALSARLHLHSRQWKKSAAFQRKVWDFDAMLGARPLWGDWRAGTRPTRIRQATPADGRRCSRATPRYLWPRASSIRPCSCRSAACKSSRRRRTARHHRFR